MFRAHGIVIGICLLIVGSGVAAEVPVQVEGANRQNLPSCTQSLTACPLAFPTDVAKENTGVILKEGIAPGNLVGPLPVLGDGSEGVLTPWAEQDWGRRIMMHIRRDPDYLGDARVRDYFSTVAQKLAAAAVRIAKQGLDASRGVAASDYSPLYSGSGTRVQRRAFIELSQTFKHIAPDFEVFAVRDSEINAFSLPGGFIGINTGLIAETQTESELASVLAHEMGHALQRHSARKRGVGTRSTYATVAGMVLGALAGAATGSMDVGGAVMASAQAYGVDSQLKFSRVAEHEADRIGFLLLETAGYDPYGMSAFFERLEKASPSESSVPVYTRTHPLTQERIADMSERARRARYRQPQQDPEYGFVRAQLIVEQAHSEHEYVRIRQVFKNALHSQTTPNRAADAYGMALTYLQTHQIARARKSLEQAQCLFRLGLHRVGSSLSNCKTSGNALLDRHALSLDILDVELTRLGPQADPMKALALAQAAAKRWPDSRAAQEAYIKAHLTAGQYKAAQTLARAQARLEPYQSIWWRYVAQASAALDDSVSQQRALAEQYALEGAWPSAIGQLETARKTPGLDFYVRAQIESRIKEMKALYKRAQEDEKSGLPA